MSSPQECKPQDEQRGDSRHAIERREPRGRANVRSYAAAVSAIIVPRAIAAATTESARTRM